MGKANGWYTKGPTRDDLEKVRREFSGGKVQRFFLKAKESKKIIFMDDVPFGIWEHNFVINNEYWHFFTCRKGVDPVDPICMMCSSGIRRSYHGYVTILDATGYENKKGERVLYQRKLFPMTLKTLDRFYLIKEKKTTLIGAQFDITRSSSEAVKVGDMWDFEGFVNPFKDQEYWYYSNLKKQKLAPEPFDYLDILKPLSNQEMNMNVVGMDDKSGDDVDGDVSGGDKDVSGGDEDELY